MIGGTQHGLEKMAGGLPFFVQHRTHATAHVHQHRDGERQIGLAREVADLAISPVLADFEVLLAKIPHQRAAFVRNGAKDVDQIHVHFDC